MRSPSGTVSALTLPDAARKTWIYFIQAGENGPIKIGVAKDPDERLAALQQGNPEMLRGLTATWGLPEFEQRLHRAFSFCRIRGEWFQPDPRLRIFIDLLDFAEPFWFRQDMPPEMEELAFG